MRAKPPRCTQVLKNPPSSSASSACVPAAMWIENESMYKWSCGSNLIPMCGNCWANLSSAQLIAAPRAPDEWSLASRMHRRSDPLRHCLDLNDFFDPLDDLLNFPGHDLLNDLLDRHFHDLLNLNDLLNRNFLPYDPFDLLGYDLLDLLSDDLLDLNLFDHDPVDRDFPGHHLRLAAGRQRYRTGNPQGGGAAHAKHLSSCNHSLLPLPPGQPLSDEPAACIARIQGARLATSRARK